MPSLPILQVTTTQYKHHVNRTVTAFRGAMVSLIYAKTLALPAGLRDESAALTLMSTDIDRLAISLDSLSEIWARLIEISIGIWLLARRLGWVCAAPIVIVTISVSASSWVANQIGPRQAHWIKAIQRRVGITSSILRSMKSVKMMGLSDKLSDTLNNHRIEELKLSKQFRIMSLWRVLLCEHVFLYGQNFPLTEKAFIPTIFAPLSCFVIFSIQSSRHGSDPLTAGDTFSSLAIISLLTNPASNFLQSLPMVGMSTGCLYRIQKFLLSESREDQKNVPIEGFYHTDCETQMEETSIELQQDQPRSTENAACTFKNANIPASSTTPSILHDISLQIERESMTMIVGAVGAGKSTLLKAIIGELNCTSGSLNSDSWHKAYCAQTPWLPNSTVRRIICGYHDRSAEDERWYNTVVHACALDEDVRLLPFRDDTIIGSRGVTLSGGQKQRLVGCNCSTIFGIR